MITVIAIFFNNRREAPRTLFSLSTEYQENICESQYRVLAIDSGSTEPLDRATVESMGRNFEYHFVSTNHPSPIEALRYGLQRVESRYTMVFIDGARILSPNVLSKTIQAISLYPTNPFIYTLSLHLGEIMQNASILDGYNQRIEDELLEQSNWKEHGYRLFGISNINTSPHSFFTTTAESNCFTVDTSELRRRNFPAEFTSKGGGLVNLDIFKQFVEDERVTTVSIIGEASFHQIHGGVSTNITRGDHPLPEYKKEYFSIYNKYYSPPIYSPVYFGSVNDDINYAIRATRLTVHLALIREFLADKNDKTAWDITKKTIDLYQSEAYVVYQLANVFHIANRSGQARKLLTILLEIDPIHPQGLALLAQLSYEKKALNKAEKLFKKSIQHEPCNPLAYHFLSSIENVRNNKHEAQKYLNKAINMSTNPVNINLLIKIINDNERNTQVVINCCKQIISIKPDHTYALLTLSNAYVKIKDFDQAIYSADRCLDSLETKNITTRIAIANIYATCAKYAKAEKILNHALAIQPDNAWILLSLANTYELQENKEQTQKALESAAQKLIDTPHKVPIALQCTNKLIKHNNFSLANKVNITYLKRHPLNSALHFRHGQLNELLFPNDLSKAILSFEQAAFFKYPNKVLIHQKLVELYHKTGSKKELLHLFKLEGLTQKEHELSVINNRIKDTRNRFRRYNKNKYDSIIFTHIQKCAGSTIRRMLSESAIINALLPEEVHIPDELGRTPYENIVQLTPEQLESFRNRKTIVLADHSGYDTIKKYNLLQFKKPFRMTFLRNPIERFISYYYFFFFNKSMNYENLAGVHLNDLSEIDLKNILKNLANVQCSFLSGVSDFDNSYSSMSIDSYRRAKYNLDNRYHFYGLQERFDESVKRLKDVLPEWFELCDTKYPKVNIGSNIRRNIEIKPSHLNIIKEFNEFDLKLHKYATNKFNNATE